MSASGQFLPDTEHFFIIFDSSIMDKNPDRMQALVGGKLFPVLETTHRMMFRL